ncbi:MAG: hypothetical protein JW957_01845 [Candidatus Omnitrophica bacterium]|nr:hypothetical protein [Candidatus Omnitrophota bacterium]
MSIAEKQADEIAATLRDNGALWSLREEWCSQAFQQAHAVRAMLAVHRIKPKRQYLPAAKEWAVMTLNMQGTHGHPDRYNMGYGFRTRRGITQSWFVADCGTIAVTLLDTASLLERGDSLRAKILDSVNRFAGYIIKEWSMPDGSFSLGFYDFEKMNKKTYHCATAQSNLFLWPLYKMTGNELYRKQAVGCTRWMANWKGYDESYFGNSLGNRAYNGESLMVSLSHLGKEEKKLREEVLAHIKNGIVDWALENFGGSWFKDGKPSHAKDPLLLMVMRLAKPILKDSRLSKTVNIGYASLNGEINKSVKAVKKHGISGTAIASHVKPDALKKDIFLPKYYSTDGLSAMATAVYTDAKSLFPLGKT